ncbi:hypothetical protein [Bacillus sp. NPDC094077]|uniref:hypothetical protein n=1 Tax=Bacillus sp. NPDC094077 TaxID=3390932 RepID=UPI003CFC7653
MKTSIPRILEEEREVKEERGQKREGVIKVKYHNSFSYSVYTYPFLYTRQPFLFWPQTGPNYILFYTLSCIIK